jgi:2-oxoglutarate ferredoxin oxidoreductase subunit alpha
METIFVPEVNYTGQFARMVRADCGVDVIAQSQITGYPFTAVEIADFIEKHVPARAKATA